MTMRLKRSVFPVQRARGYVRWPAACVASLLLCLSCQSPRSESVRPSAPIETPISQSASPIAPASGAPQGAFPDIGPSGLPDPRTMTFPPQAFGPPRARRVALPNGMTLFVMEEHELPLISVDVLVRVGALYDPADKIGLAELTGTVLRTGGTARQTGDAIDIWADGVAAVLSSDIGVDVGSLSLDILKKDFDVGLQVLADILMRPVFADEELEVARNAMIEAIRRRNDHPNAIASREFHQQVYGVDHPYGREATEATARAIAREDLVAFHKKYVVPNGAMMAITGDFDTTEMIKKIEAAFSDWSKMPVSFPEIPAVHERETGGVYQIARPISQAQIRMGHLSIKQDHPDYFALSILDDILGAGGFSSRMFNDIRTQRGLAYAVGSVLRPGHFERGVFLAYGETRNETTYQTLAAMIEHISAIRRAPVSEEEITRAKASFLNSFIFSFAGAAQIVRRQMSLAYYGLPEDFLERFRDNVAKVTQDDILRVAQAHLHPDRLVILVVGDASRFDQSLSTFGAVHELSLTP